MILVLPQMKPQEKWRNILKMQKKLIQNYRLMKLWLGIWTIRNLEKNVELFDEAGTILFRGSKEYLDKYLKFVKLPLKEKKVLLEKVYQLTKQNTGKVYNAGESNKKLKDIGVKYYIDYYNKGAKVTPDFSPMGFDMFMIAGKLGNGNYGLITKIRGYSKTDILEALKKIKEFKGTVNVNVTSTRSSDFINCWKEMGIDPSLGAHIEQKLKLTWHHLDDLNVSLKSYFQLVISKIHAKTSQHMGSHFQIEKLLDLIQ